MSETGPWTAVAPDARGDAEVHSGVKTALAVRVTVKSGLISMTPRDGRVYGAQCYHSSVRSHALAGQDTHFVGLRGSRCDHVP